VTARPFPIVPRRLPLPALTPLRVRALRDGLSIGGLLFFGFVFFVGGPIHGGPGYDAQSYWAVNLDAPYAGGVGSEGFFPYSPAAAQVASLFHPLPWELFRWLWVGLLLVALWWMARDWTLAALAFPPVTIELFYGNVNILIAAAIVLGLRYPAAWAAPILLKGTPGIGLIWFAVQRKWWSLAVAIGVTVGVAALSFLAAPGIWFDWIRALGTNFGGPSLAVTYLPVPLWLRLPIAAVVAVWGARTDRRWTVPVAATIAMPVWWPTVFAILVGVIPLVRTRQVTRSG
jgi:hypothetical protein